MVLAVSAGTRLLSARMTTILGMLSTKETCAHKPIHASSFLSTAPLYFGEISPAGKDLHLAWIVDIFYPRLTCHD